MFKTIQEKHNFEGWQNADPRYKRLFFLDRAIDCTLYDDLTTSFKQEVENKSHYIPIHNRRPSVQLNLPKMVAGMLARKMFAQTHAPALKHKNPKIKSRVQALNDELKILNTMLEAAKVGSVGSVFITFNAAKTAQGVKCVFEVHRARFCNPSFDAFRELKAVRIAYTINGLEAIRAGHGFDYEGEPVKISTNYWYVKDLDTKMVCAYKLIKYGDWNPTDGKKERLVLAEAPAVHNLGYVPGVWVRNSPGGHFPDGECTFEGALPNFIELDYQMSQAGRGFYYGAAPQLMVKGDLKNWDKDGEEVTGPANVLHMSADITEAAARSDTGHDAKILEINGAGLKANIEYISKLLHFAMQQICMARKDPDTIRGAMSGKAMELIDQEFLDLFRELQIQYCEYGMLPLVKKVVKALVVIGHPLVKGLSDSDIDGLQLDYPAPFSVDPADLQALSIGLSNAIEAQMITAPDAGAYFKTMINFVIDTADNESLDVDPVPSTGPEDNIAPGTSLDSGLSATEGNMPGLDL